MRTTKQLLGRAGERFLLFGQLGYSKEGKLCLEDSDGRVELDLSQLVSPILPPNHVESDSYPQDIPSEGFFTDGCFALIEGDYTEDETLVVIAIGHPPCETREIARSIYGHIDFLGQGATTPAEDVSHLRSASMEQLLTPYAERNYGSYGTRIPRSYVPLPFGRTSRSTSDL